MAPAANTICAPLTACGARRIVGGLDRRRREAEALLDGLGGRLGALLLTRGDGDVGAFDIEHRRGAHADRAGAGEHDGLLALERLALASSATPAAAVVLEPFESSITETRKFEKKRFFTALNTASPAVMSPPPTKIAVYCFSFGRACRWCRRPARRRSPASRCHSR